MNLKYICVALGIACISNLSASQKVVTVNVIAPPSIDNIAVPVVKTVYEGKEEQVQSTDKENVEKFGRRMPPGYGKNGVKTIAKPVVEQDLQAGDVKGGRISAYLEAPYMSVQDFEKKLQASGFINVASYPVDAKGEYVSVVFTTQELMEASSLHTRGFNATLRALVNKKDKTVSIVNPRYQLKAFMQESFDEKLAKSLLDKLRTNFSTLTDSNEKVKYSIVSNYRFMDGMPKYQDMEVVSMANSNVQLLERAKKKNKIVFTIKLANGTFLTGIKLSKETSSFVAKIGYEHAELLPYPVLLEDNKAKIMDPKYYISVMYPSLTMEKFMKIANVPGTISKECSKIFR